MQTEFNSNYDDMDEIKTLLGLDGYQIELEEMVCQKELSNLMQSVYGLISKKIFNHFLEKLSKVDKRKKSENYSNNNTMVTFPKKENLFDNFDDFVKNNECRNLNFSIIEKNPSAFLNILHKERNLKEDKKMDTALITLSNDFYKVINNFLESPEFKQTEIKTSVIITQEIKIKETNENTSTTTQSFYKTKKNNKKENIVNSNTTNITPDQLFETPNLAPLKTKVNPDQTTNIEANNQFQGNNYSNNNKKYNQKTFNNKSTKDKWKGTKPANYQNNNSGNNGYGQNTNENYYDNTYVEDSYNDNTTSNYNNYDGSYNKVYKPNGGNNYYSANNKKKGSNNKY